MQNENCESVKNIFMNTRLQKSSLMVRILSIPLG